MLDFLAAAAPTPIVITEDIPQDWWEIALAVLTSVGTVAAVVAALVVSYLDRRRANQQAKEDRQSFADRQAKRARARSAHGRRSMAARPAAATE